MSGTTTARERRLLVTYQSMARAAERRGYKLAGMASNVTRGRERHRIAAELAVEAIGGGARQVDVARSLGVSTRTVRRWWTLRNELWEEMSASPEGDL